MSVIVMAMPGVRDWTHAVPETEPGNEGASIEEILERFGPTETRLVCFYCAPWEAALAFIAGDTQPEAGSLIERIDDWAWHHAVLAKAWRDAPKRVILVNSGRIADPKVVCHRLSDLGISVDEDRLPRCGGTLLPDWARSLLAAQFAEWAPEAWECYEALESCAQVTGETPELRGTMELGDVTNLEWLLRLVGGALHDWEASRRDYMKALDDGRLAQQRENEVLLHQIEQLHEALAQSTFQVRAANLVAERATVLGERARHMMSRLSKEALERD